VADTSEAIRELLASIVGPGVIDTVGDDELIFEQRVVDSLHLVQLIGAIEARFGIEVAGDELSPENFESIGAMAAFVTRKSGA
jgi:acyl carrier protein